MATSKMKPVNILADNEYLGNVLLKFVGLDYFHPGPASKFVDNVHGLTTLSDENPITDVLTRFNGMLQDVDMMLPVKDVRNGVYDLEGIHRYIDSVHERFENRVAICRGLETVIQGNRGVLMRVRNIKGIDLNLDDLFECRYIKIRFGRLPIDSVEKLQYYRNRPSVFRSFSTDDTYSWCVYLTTAKYEGDVNSTFSSLYFERTRIPESVRGNPIQAKENLQGEVDNDLRQLQHVNGTIEAPKAEYTDNSADIKAELEFIDHTFGARKCMLDLGEGFSITGSMVEEGVPKLKELFSNLKGVGAEARPAHSDKRPSPPIKLKSGWFAKPPSMSVEMYGTPEYEGIDPTFFTAFTYSFLFGIMPGDLGQGFTLILVEHLLHKWEGIRLGEVGMCIGIFSSIFGIVYDSAFDNEELLNPLYETVFGLSEKPVEVITSDFIPVLPVMAAGLGTVLIVIGISINPCLQIKNKNYGELFFSQNGITGLVFYISPVGGGAYQLLGGTSVITNPISAIVLLLVSPVLIFLKEALERKMEKREVSPGGLGGFSVGSFSGLPEIYLSFITDTISHLRVGGFALSYAGMMMAVMLIMDMAGGAEWIVMILGNIFAMCLGGMIARTQIFHLKFYETLSRYFTGNGIMFKSLDD